MSDAAPADEFLLEMRGINKSFPGVKALDNAQLKVRPYSVHALMGENGAGKSTLLKCLFGIYHADAGEILFCGRPVAYRTSKEALENGISMVHQELNLVPQVSVMDNLWLGRYPQKGPFIDHAKMYRDTKAIFDELGIDVDPRQKVADLTVSQMQMIEIAKAFSYNAKIVIMDEPTSSLSEKEVNHLFGIIQKLKDRGCGIIYISHKMDEIFRICDEITILRDGQWIDTRPVAGLTFDDVIKMMVGRELGERFPEKTNKPAEIVLEVRGLTARNQPSIQDVSFDLRRGEILGIAGLVGAKRTDIVETLFGIREASSGVVRVRGKGVSTSKVSGDLVARVAIQVPEKPNRELKRLAKEMAQAMRTRIGAPGHAIMIARRPSPAHSVVPVVEGSAKRFWVTSCMTIPLIDIAAPERTSAIVRGTRTARKILPVGFRRSPAPSWALR